MPKCYDCGGEIIFRYVGSVCTPIHLSGGCWGKGSSGVKSHTSPTVQPKRPSFWLDQGSVTFLTKCWWCGEPVYFYRNEDGGCALFDSLGQPWPIHGCWEAHQADRPKAVSGILLTHKATLLSGSYTFPSASQVADRNGTTHEIVGHLHKTKEEFDFIHTKRHGDFIHIEILGNDRKVYHALFPLAWFPFLEGAPLFHLKCISWKRGRRTDFFPLMMSVCDEKGGKTDHQTAIDVQAVVKDNWTFQIRKYGDIWKRLHLNQQNTKARTPVARNIRKQKGRIQLEVKAKKKLPPQKPKPNSFGIFKNLAEAQAVKDAIKPKEGNG